MVWTIRLDHGLGFFKTRRALSFVFQATPESQAAKLAAQSLFIDSSMGEQGTFVYLTDVCTA